MISAAARRSSIGHNSPRRRMGRRRERVGLLSSPSLSDDEDGSGARREPACDARLREL